MSSENEQEDDGLVARKKPSEAASARLRQAYEKGQQNAKQRNFDYATQMFAQCIEGDPGNIEYVKAFMENLQKKYNNNKKGSNFAGFKGMGAKGTIKKSLGKKEWDTAIKAGLELLQINPWDVGILTQIATATAGVGGYETQLYYLKIARDFDPKDIEVNRTIAKALAKIGQFDQAMVIWENIKKHHPNNEEAQTAIAALHADKMQAMSSTKEGAKGIAKKGEGKAGSKEDELKQRLAADPGDVGVAGELCELYAREERYTDAEELLTKTLEATGGDLKVREYLEDVQLRRARYELIGVEKKVQESPTDENKEALKQKQIDVNRVELDVYRSRSERYPGNTNTKYEFAVRLKRAGLFNEAIKAFQEARSDPKRKGTVYIELGDCFYRINQKKLAMSNYITSLDNMTDRDFEPKKLGLYRIGALAMELADLDTAEKYLTELAGMDFGYRDVSERLDKIAKMRNKE